MTKKTILIVGIIATIAIVYVSFSSEEECIKIINNSSEELQFYRSDLSEADTNMYKISVNETVCIGNWEGFFGKIRIKNRGLATIKEKYDFLRVVKHNGEEIDLLSVMPKYENTGHENHYLYFIE